jgi:delta24-sterol reductase
MKMPLVQGLFFTPITVFIWAVTRLLWPMLYKKPSVFSVTSTLTHKAKVERIQEQVSQQRGAGRLFTARPDRERISSRMLDGQQRTNKIQTSDLNQIVSIDFESLRVKVEPRVSVRQISDLLVPHGFSLQIIPELDDLTVGGLLMGCGIESTSFKHGMFFEQCVEYELVDANAEILKVTAESDPDLFANLPWSHGTFGLLTSATLKIEQIKKYVSLEVQRFGDNEQMSLFMQDKCKDMSLDFVEAFQFTATHSVVTFGKYSDTAGELTDLFSWHGPWFYKVLQYVSSDGCTLSFDAMQYLHRHSKSIFWELGYLQPWGHQAWFRWIAGWLNPPKIALVKKYQPKLTLEHYMRSHIVQDYLLPIEKTAEMLKLGTEHLGVYPVWICPYVNKKHKSDGLMHPPGANDHMYVDVGYYGLPDHGRTTVGTPGACLNKCFDMDSALNKIEKWLMACKGYVMLYAYHTLSEDELRQMFDHKTYDATRKRLNASPTFPSLWDKVKCR